MSLSLILPPSLGFLGATPIIQTDDGPIQGVARPGLTVYHGVPFAAAPVGRLRFANPER